MLRKATFRGWVALWRLAIVFSALLSGASDDIPVEVRRTVVAKMVRPWLGKAVPLPLSGQVAIQGRQEVVALDLASGAESFAVSPSFPFSVLSTSFGFAIFTDDGIEMRDDCGVFLGKHATRLSQPDRTSKWSCGDRVGFVHDRKFTLVNATCGEVSVADFPMELSIYAPVSAYAYSPKHDLLALAGHAMVCVIDLNDLLSQSISPASGRVFAFAFDDERSRLYSLEALDGRFLLAVSSLASPSVRRELDLVSSEDSTYCTIGRGRWPALGLVVLPGDELLIAICGRNAVVVDTGAMRKVRDFSLIARRAQGTAHLSHVDSNAMLLVTASGYRWNSDRLSIWDLNTGALCEQKRLKYRVIRDLQPIGDGAYIVLSDERLQRWKNAVELLRISR